MAAPPEAHVTSYTASFFDDHYHVVCTCGYDAEVFGVEEAKRVAVEHEHLVDEE